VLGFLPLILLFILVVFVLEFVKVSLVSVYWFACISLILHACSFLILWRNEFSL